MSIGDAAAAIIVSFELSALMWLSAWHLVIG